MQPHSARTILIRISLILVILASIAVVGLNLNRVKKKITTLQTNLAAQTAAREKAETELAGTRSVLATTTATLQKTKANLEAAVDEKQKALAVATAQTERADKLGGDLAQTRQERNDAREYLARYRAAGLEPDQIAFAATQIKRLQDNVAVVEQENKMLAMKVKTLLGAASPGPEIVTLPAGLKARVVACDPKWHFVVLDAGESQGVLARGELLVSRNGKLVAKARVSSVQKDRCVANLMPGWELSEVVEGDLVFPAHPDS
jgi:hypothetical protein